MSAPIPELDETFVAAAVWRRSGRPWRGQLVRAYVAVSFVAAALLFLSGPVSWLVAASMTVLALVVPFAVDRGLLRRWERRIAAIDRRGANGMQEALRADRWIRNLAPHAWVALQEGILQLRRNDGRAAARCFAEAERLAGARADTSSLRSAQAHAHVLAGDRKPARDLLERLKDTNTMSARDHLDLGLVLLQEAGHTRDARAELERAHAQLGDHPRVLAALALVEQKAGDEETAYTHFLAAERGLAGREDALGEELVKRARKTLRDRIKREQKRARRDEARVVDGARRPPQVAPEANKRKRREKRPPRPPRSERAKASPRAASVPAAAPAALVPSTPGPRLPPAPRLPAPPRVGPSAPAPPRVAPSRPKPARSGEASTRGVDAGWGDVLDPVPVAPIVPPTRKNER